ncbi:hypothetical protein V2J09_000209 [Rumex salicifolius]
MSMIDNKVNMTTCYKHCEHFFKRFKSIHFKVLIAYWMMAGFLGDHNIHSGEEAFRKGFDILVDLVYKEKILRVLNCSPGMIEFAKSSKIAKCKHRGFCVAGNLGFVDVLDLAAIGKVVVPKDGRDSITEGSFYVSDPLISGSYQNQGLNKYKSVINLEISDSLEATLANVKNPSVLLLRGFQVSPSDFDTLEKLESLIALEISGIKDLTSLENLQILNLSQTFVTKLPDMSKLVMLKELLLGDCQHLELIPDLESLANLETLDLSLPSNSLRLEIDTKAQKDLSYISVPSSLRKLVLTNRSGMHKLFDITKLCNLEFLDLRGTDVIGLDNKLQTQQPQVVSKPVEIHVVSADNGSNSQQINQVLGLDNFEEVFTKWDAFILEIHTNLNSTMHTANTTVVDHQALKTQVEMLRNDLRYVQENFELLKNSHNWNTCKGLLQELSDAAIDLSSTDFAIDSANFKQLFRMVVKLKLLIPRNQTNPTEALEITKKKRSPFMRSKSKENVSILGIIEDKQETFHGLNNSYRSLSNIQKLCLLTFSIFPYNKERDKNAGVYKSLVIKKKILIYWWVGEGFIDPLLEENVGFESTPNTNHNQDTTMRKDIGGGGVGERIQASLTMEVKKSKTIEEIGNEILHALAENGFIEFVVKKGLETGSCCIYPVVQSFVIKQAIEEGFFDFDSQSGMLTPHFTLSKRACLLKSQETFPSSCKIWGNYIGSPNKLEAFKSVKTLFNVSESMIHIKHEWFSKMKNLLVLHLGNWHSENSYRIEIEDQMFLEDLKRMKQLRLLSLQGLPTIMKLPESVCHLSSLLILDLRECSYLEELPANIGSLKCLTHLDISHCPLLTKLPKGISFLSKLEVLEGFVITHQHATRERRAGKMSIIKQHMIYGLFSCGKSKSCTLRDLLKLERLRKLSITVNISKFPEDEDLKVFKEMKNLCKLKILWERSICTKDIIGSATGHEVLVGQNIKKLELWCFPYENRPYWLNPRELNNLNKLYIVGGNLKELHVSDTNESRWNVETLRLKYLRNLNITWPELKIMFPRLAYLEKRQCDHLAIFPCGDEGIWRSTV